MNNNNDDVIKKAVAAAAAKAGFKDIESLLNDIKKRPELAPTTTIGKIVNPVPIEEKIKVPTSPIWPMDDVQLATWKKEIEERPAKEKAAAEALTKWLESAERKAELQRWINESIARWKETRPRAKQEATEPKEVVAKTPKVKKESRQTRLGQTSMIDELLKAGKTEKEVFDTVREKIPEYPADKLPKLIKLRQYHVKK